MRISPASKDKSSSKVKRTRLASRRPASNIPTGAVHEYKVTKGAGTVTVLFCDRGYTHEDKPFDASKGEREFAKYAGSIFCST